MKEADMNDKDMSVNAANLCEVAAALLELARKEKSAKSVNAEAFATAKKIYDNERHARDEVVKPIKEMISDIKSKVIDFYNEKKVAWHKNEAAMRSERDRLDEIQKETVQKKYDKLIAEGETFAANKYLVEMSCVNLPPDPIIPKPFLPLNIKIDDGQLVIKQTDSLEVSDMKRLCRDILRGGISPDVIAGVDLKLVAYLVCSEVEKGTLPPNAITSVDVGALEKEPHRWADSGVKRKTVFGLTIKPGKVRK